MLYTISIIVEYIKLSNNLNIKKFAPNILNVISPIMKNIGVIITFASLYIWYPFTILYMFAKFHISSPVLRRMLNIAIIENIVITNHNIKLSCFFIFSIVFSFLT